MASIMKRGDSYSVRYKYKDHSGKPCEGWESFKTRKEAQERKITVEKELLDGTFLVPDTITVEEMLYKWIPIQSTKHKWSPKTYTQSVAMVQNLIVPYIGNRKVQELRTYDIEKFYATLAKTPCGQYVHGVKQKLSDKQKKRLLSSTSIHEVHTLLKTAFSYAVEWDLIHKIPLPRDAPKVNIEERTIWDEKEEEVAQCRPFFDEQPRQWVNMGVQADNLAGEYFITTGSGKFFRNVEPDPVHSIGIVEINDKGDSWRIVWGLEGGAKPTSEFPSHFMNHSVRKAATNGANRVIYHCHATNVIALTYILPLTDRDFTRALWQSATECPVVFPEGVGVCPWMVPGGADIAMATSELMKHYQAAVWAQHGLFASGPDFDITFGLAHTIEKSAEIYVKVLSMGGGIIRQTITDDDLRAIAHDFGVTLNEKFLN